MKTAQRDVPVEAPRLPDAAKRPKRHGGVFPPEDRAGAAGRLHEAVARKKDGLEEERLRVVASHRPAGRHGVGLLHLFDGLEGGRAEEGHAVEQGVSVLHVGEGVEGGEGVVGGIGEGFVVAPLVERPALRPRETGGQAAKLPLGRRVRALGGGVLFLFRHLPLGLREVLQEFALAVRKISHVLHQRVLVVLDLFRLVVHVHQGDGGSAASGPERAQAGRRPDAAQEAGTHRGDERGRGAAPHDAAPVGALSDGHLVRRPVGFRVALVPVVVVFVVLLVVVVVATATCVLLVKGLQRVQAPRDEIGRLLRGHRIRIGRLQHLHEFHLLLARYPAVLAGIHYPGQQLQTELHRTCHGGRDDHGGRRGGSGGGLRVVRREFRLAGLGVGVGVRISRKG
mmetsp:Transcript_48241/g.94244  ORF Transcript_48241/g.94244 Transcript_48241/m.94244 type:complete len:396 (-) Transcript_48241:112-1299(-)